MTAISETNRQRAPLAALREWAAARPDTVSLLTTLLVLLGLVAIFYAANDRFLSQRNIAIILNQSAPYVILGVGMTLVIATRGIDLSVGSIVAAAGMVLDARRGRRTPGARARRGNCGGSSRRGV